MRSGKFPIYDVFAFVFLFTFVVVTVYFLVVHELRMKKLTVTTKERVVQIDDPQEGQLVLYTVGGKVGGNMEDINVLLREWARTHPQFIPQKYHLSVEYARRDSLRVGQ